MSREEAIITAYHLFWCQPLLLFTFVIWQNMWKVGRDFFHWHAHNKQTYACNFHTDEPGQCRIKSHHDLCIWSSGEINTTAVCSPSHSTAPPFSVNAIYFRRQKNAKCSPPWKICFAILFKRSYDEERCWAKIYTEHHISENQGFGTNRLARAQTISSHSHHFDRHDWVLQRRGARIFMILYKNNLCSLVRDGSGCQAFLC